MGVVVMFVRDTIFCHCFKTRNFVLRGVGFEIVFIIVFHVTSSSLKFGMRTCYLSFLSLKQTHIEAVVMLCCEAAENRTAPMTAIYGERRVRAHCNRMQGDDEHLKQHALLPLVYMVNETNTDFVRYE